MRIAIGWAGLTLGMLFGTMAIGWIAVPILAAIWGAAWGGGRGALRVPAFAGAAAWSLLLLRVAALGPLGELAGRVGGVFRLPGPMMIALTVLVAVALALTASGLAASGRELLRAARATRPLRS